jgi:FkbM family methyltransferase
MGRKVLCVEPFYDNIIRIHKAAQLEKLYNDIIVIKNALSNKPNEIKKLAKSDNNIGGQSLLPHNNEVLRKSDNISTETDKYLVETVLFDDLVDYLPKVANSNRNVQRAIVKIDIEGFEPHALSNATKIFKVLDICIIYMEWGQKKRHNSDVNLVDGMISFLTKQGLKPYDGARSLQGVDWNNWPWDLIWKKDGF